MKRKEIELELLNLGSRAHRKGFSQMVSVLDYIMSQDEVLNTTSTLYPRLAETLNTSPMRIERNIRTEISAIWVSGNQDKLDELFVNRSSYPPGAKEFLYTLARRLSYTTNIN